MSQHSRFSTVFPSLPTILFVKAAFQARWQAFSHFPFSIRLELWCTEVTKPTPHHRDWRKTSPQQLLPITTDYQWVWHRYRIISGHQRDVIVKSRGNASVTKNPTSLSPLPWQKSIKTTDTKDWNKAGKPISSAQAFLHIQTWKRKKRLSVIMMQSRYAAYGYSSIAS